MPAKPGTHLRCSRCQGPGHNARTCGVGRAPRRRGDRKAQNLWVFYRLRFPEYLAMVEQGCGICGTDLSSRTPDVDHDHSCDCPGKGSSCCREHVRGVLCRSCNLRVGAFERGQNHEPRIAEYLGRKVPAPDSDQLSMF